MATASKQAPSPAVDGHRSDPVPAREADSASDINPTDPSGHNGDGKSDDDDSDDDDDHESDGGSDNDDDDDGSDNESDNESDNSGDGNGSHARDRNLDSDGEPNFDKLRSEGFINKEVSGRRTLISRWKSQKIVDGNVMIELKDGLWEKLQTCIRDASFVLCPREMSLEMFDRHDATRLSWIVKDRAWHRLTTSSTLPFCMTWIWHLLYDNLFARDCKNKWRKGPWSDFGALIRNLQDRVPHEDNEFTVSFFTGKQFMARGLFMHHGTHSDPDRLKAIIFQNLRTFIFAQDPRHRQVEEALDKIVALALQIDLSLVTSRFDIRIEMEEPETGLQAGFGFSKHSKYMEIDPSYLQELSATEGRSVDFVASPMVRFYGKSRRYTRLDSYKHLYTSNMVKRYDVETVLRPMKVVLGPGMAPPPVPRQPPPDDQPDDDDDKSEDEDEDARPNDDPSSGSELPWETIPLHDSPVQDPPPAIENLDAGGETYDNGQAENDQQADDDTQHGPQNQADTTDQDTTAHQDTAAHQQADTDQQTDTDQPASRRGVGSRLRHQKRVNYYYTGRSNKRSKSQSTEEARRRGDGKERGRGQGRGQVASKGSRTR